MNSIQGAGWALIGLAATLLPVCVAGVIGGHQGVGWTVGGFLLASAAAVLGWWVYTSGTGDHNWVGSRGVGMFLAVFAFGAAFSIGPLYMAANGVPGVGLVSAVEVRDEENADHPDISLAGWGELRYPADLTPKVGDYVPIRYDPRGWFVTMGPDPWGFIDGLLGTLTVVGAAGVVTCGALGAIGTHGRARRRPAPAAP